MRLRLYAAAIVASIPIVFWAHAQLAGQLQSIQATRSEAAGIARVDRVSDLLADVAKARQERVSGTGSSDAARRVESDLAYLGRTSPSADVSADVRSLSLAWRTWLRSRPGTRLRVASIVETLDSDVADATGISVDPDLGFAYLFDTFAYAPVDLAEPSDELASQYAAIASGTEAPFSTRLSIARTDLLSERMRTAARSDLEGIFRTEPHIATALSRPYAALFAASENLSRRVRPAMDGMRTTPPEKAAVAAARRAIVSSTAKLRDGIRGQIALLLDRRLAKERANYLWTLAVCVGIALLFFCGAEWMARALEYARRREAQHVEERERALEAEVARRRAEQGMLLSRAQFRAIFDDSPLGIAVVDESVTTTEVNATLTKMLGEHTKDAIAATTAHAEDVIAGRKSAAQFEIGVAGPSGPMFLNVTASRVELADESDRRVMMMLQDVTDRKRAEEQLTHDALHDALTGLPKRTLFLERARTDGGLAVTARARAIVFIDVNNFKAINDGFGHSVGDRVLVEVAARLRRCTRSGDEIARLHGDEFCVLLRNVESEEQVERTVDRMRALFSEPIAADEARVEISASFGVVVFDHFERDIESMLERADVAMYEAKRCSDLAFVFFNDELEARENRKRQVARHLRSAIDYGELSIAYQPVVHIGDGRIVAFEALARWRNPQLGDVGPDEFIPIAEESDTIVEIGRYVLREACMQLARWRWESRRGDDLSVTVNVSPRQLRDARFAHDVEDAIRASGISGRDLVLEVTEHSMLQDNEHLRQRFNELRALGVRISIDDFGMGYSSLRYLDEFVFDILKIDRSFVSGPGGEIGNEPIVTMLLSLSRALGVHVIAEGIETDAQAAHLQRLDCEFGQGYRFSRPVPPERAFALLVGKGDVARAATGS